MIMDLPNEFSIGDERQKTKVFIENGILKVQKEASFRKVIYGLTYKIHGGNHICKYCNRIFKEKK